MEIPSKHPLAGKPKTPRAEGKVAAHPLDLFHQRVWQSVGMYAFVCSRWVDPLANWIGNRRVLEVMSGAGWLAGALRDRGIHIKATDNHKYKDSMNWELMTEIEELDHLEAISKYGRQSDLLIISWPQKDEGGYDSLRHMYRINPNALVVYIGEFGTNITGGPMFHAHFEIIKDTTFEAVALKYETWPFLNDRPYLGRFKP